MIHTTEPSTTREDQVGGEPHALDERAGHDRRGRPGEEEEGEEEDEAEVAREVALHVRAQPRAPGCGQPAEAGDRIGAGVAVLRPAFLEAAVDVPAEVVEGRRDDGDREDVLHRRRHDVLASRDARLVGHEADVDQPHDHDGPEVERAPSGSASRASSCSLSSSIVGVSWASNDKSDESMRVLLRPHRAGRGQTYETALARFHVRSAGVAPVVMEVCYIRRLGLYDLARRRVDEHDLGARLAAPSPRRRARRPSSTPAALPAGGSAPGTSSGSKSISFCAIATASS